VGLSTLISTLNKCGIQELHVQTDAIEYAYVVEATSMLRGERRCASVKQILAIHEVASPHYITTEAQKACDSGPFTIPELCVPVPCPHVTSF